jgi:predicted Zn-dependent peptidase
VVSIIMEELEQLRQEGLREEELARARKLARSRILLRLEDTRNVAGWLGGQELLLGRIRTPEEVLQEIEQVTAEDIKRVAQELLQPQAACLAAVGPLPSDGPLASALGA